MKLSLSVCLSVSLTLTLTPPPSRIHIHHYAKQALICEDCVVCGAHRDHNTEPLSEVVAVIVQSINVRFFIFCVCILRFLTLHTLIYIYICIPTNQPTHTDTYTHLHTPTHPHRHIYTPTHTPTHTDTSTLLSSKAYFFLLLCFTERAQDIA